MLPIPPDPLPPPPRYSVKVVFAPGIVVRERDLRQVSEFRDDMLRAFDECLDRGHNPKASTGLRINELFEFLRRYGTSYGFYAIADYVEGEMRRVRGERQSAIRALVTRSHSRECA